MLLCRYYFFALKITEFKFRMKIIVYYSVSLARAFERFKIKLFKIPAKSHNGSCAGSGYTHPVTRAYVTFYGLYKP